MRRHLSREVLPMVSTSSPLEGPILLCLQKWGVLLEKRVGEKYFFSLLLLLLNEEKIGKTLLWK